MTSSPPLPTEDLRRLHRTIADALAIADRGPMHRLGIHLDGARLEVLAELDRRGIGMTAPHPDATDRD